MVTLNLLQIGDHARCVAQPEKEPHEGPKQTRCRLTGSCGCARFWRDVARKSLCPSDTVPPRIGPLRANSGVPERASGKAASHLSEIGFLLLLPCVGQVRLCCGDLSSSLF